MDKYGYYTDMKHVLKTLEDILRIPNMGEKRDVALLLNYKAHLCYVSKDYDKAIKKEMQALKMLPEINDETAYLHANLNADMGVYYMLKKKIEDAEQHIKRAFEIFEEFDLPTCQDTIALMSNYGNLLLLQDMGNEAVVHFEEQKNMVADKLGTDNSDYGLILLQVGTSYAFIGDWNKALTHFLESEKILNYIFNSDHPQIIVLYERILKAYQLLGNSNKCMEYKKKLRLMDKNV